MKPYFNHLFLFLILAQVNFSCNNEIKDKIFLPKWEVGTKKSITIKEQQVYFVDNDTVLNQNKLFKTDLFVVDEDKDNYAVRINFVDKRISNFLNPIPIGDIDESNEPANFSFLFKLNKKMPKLNY